MKYHTSCDKININCTTLLLDTIDIHYFALVFIFILHLET
jgi:hypothetical protein